MVVVFASKVITKLRRINFEKLYLETLKTNAKLINHKILIIQTIFYEPKKLTSNTKQSENIKEYLLHFTTN